MTSERDRMLAENRRREIEIDPDRYAPWNPAEAFMVEGRRRRAVALLHETGTFPRAGDPVLEVGYGQLGWLAEMLSWGLRLSDLYGIELDSQRAAIARAALPGADLRIGDATELPWPPKSFRLIVASTVFTSILDAAVRRALAEAITEALAPGGALLWYDFAVDNPRNRAVRGIGRKELRELFPDLEPFIRSTTLAPPLARTLAPRSHWLASTLERLPFLRTHLIGVLRKAR